MDKASNTPCHRVLHIGPTPPASPEAAPRRSPIGKLLGGLPLEAEWRPDVYRGLAALLRPSDPPTAVIVCLDGLGTPEFEFFSIVSRLRRDLKVYVYAAAHAHNKIARAVALGANGPATRKVLEELAGGAPDPGGPVDHGQAPSRGAGRRLTVPPAEACRDEGVAPMDPPEPLESSEIKHEARSGARVPWLRYADRPARVAPARRAPPHPTLSPRGGEGNFGPPPTPPLSDPPGPSRTGRVLRSSVGSSDPPPKAFEPLLTEEELQALMSDDVALDSGDDSEERRPGVDERMRGVS